jgi:hypothetical protein
MVDWRNINNVLLAKKEGKLRKAAIAAFGVNGYKQFGPLGVGSVIN